VQVGDFFCQDNKWVRRVIVVDGDNCRYRQYLLNPSAQCIRGVCGEQAMRRWGRKITEVEARALVSNMEESDRRADEEDRQRENRLVYRVLDTVHTELLIFELKERGYNVTELQDQYEKRKE
jgi:hypothetical protein